MGQKVNPHGMRVGVNKDWSSKWYADKTNFADLLVEDNQIRAFVKKKLYNAGVSNTVIERKGADEVKIIVMCARPGMVIGRSGEGIDEFKKALVKMTGKKVDVSIEEVRRTELDAQLTAESVAQSLERRTSFRRAMKQPIGRTMKAGAKGIKIVCSGRLCGAENHRENVVHAAQLYLSCASFLIFCRLSSLRRASLSRVSRASWFQTRPS